MIQAAIQAILFILIFLSYIVVIRSAIQFPLGVGTLLLGYWHRFRRKELSPRGLALMSRFESLLIAFASGLFLFCFFWFNLWNWPWLLLWENPLIIAALLFVSVHQAGLWSSHNPLLRGGARLTVYMTWPIVILLLIAIFAPQVIKPTTLKWAVASSGVALMVLGVVTLLINPGLVLRFETLRKRRDTLGESLQRLQHIANLLRDSGKWRSVQEIIPYVDRSYDRALTYLRQNRFQDAEAVLIQAEMEVAQLEKYFQDRIRLSLPDELQARLQQALTEIDDLKKEFQNEGLSAENLDKLAGEISELTTSLEKLEFSDEALLERLESFEWVFHEIADTRTALRFRRNIGSTIDSLISEVSERWLLVQVAEHIGLDTTEAKKQKQELETALDVFQTGPISSSRDLVRAYQSVQSTLTSFRAAVALLTSSLNNNWNAKTTDSGQVSIYVPKSCSTTESVRGAVLVQNEESEWGSVTVDLDGTLLELPASRTVVVQRMQGYAYGISHFSLAGKRGGKATLTMHFNNLDEINYPISFVI